MDTIYLNIAGFTIGIYFKEPDNINLKIKLKNDILKSCRGFIYEEIPHELAYSIVLKQMKSFNIKKNTLLNKYFVNMVKLNKANQLITYYQINISQFLLILRIILIKLLTSNNGLIFHSSAVNFGGKAIIFLGAQESGKSTAVKFLAEKYTPLADDISIIKKEDQNFISYQTPLWERNYIKKTSTGHLISKVFLLKKSKFPYLKQITNQELLVSILAKQIAIKSSQLDKQLLTIIDFIKNHTFYTLSYGNDKEQLSRLIQL